MKGEVLFKKYFNDEVSLKTYENYKNRFINKKWNLKK